VWAAFVGYVFNVGGLMLVVVVVVGVVVVSVCFCRAVVPT